VRAAYTRSLGGVFFDNSIRLEPSQIAGFTQAYRSIAPESAVGLAPGARFETWSIGFDQVLKKTYLGVEGEILNSKGTRSVGALSTAGGLFIPVPNAGTNTHQSLDYQEKSLLFTANQLLGDEWSVGASYRVSEADFTGLFTDVRPNANGAFRINQDVTAILHQVNLYGNFNHPSGLFAQAGSVWTQQSNRGYFADIPGDDFWQVNAFIGYRFLQRQAELKLGLLNINDQDYRLNPLNLYNELPRQRTLLVSFKFYF